jgi:hypothetical protein
MGHSIGPFVFGQYVNPPCLSHALNEEKMSGWSPENIRLSTIYIWIDEVHGVSYRYIPNPEKAILGMMDATKYVKTLGKTHAGMVFEDLSFFDGLFRTGMKFPAVTTMRNDR